MQGLFRSYLIGITSAPTYLISFRIKIERVTTWVVLKRCCHLVNIKCICRTLCHYTNLNILDFKQIEHYADMALKRTSVLYFYFIKIYKINDEFLRKKIKTWYANHSKWSSDYKLKTLIGSVTKYVKDYNESIQRTLVLILWVYRCLGEVIILNFVEKKLCTSRNRLIYERWVAENYCWAGIWSQN